MTPLRGRVAHLDGIRGIAILAVFLVHWVGQRFPAFEGGYIGVDVFFVLSGFIITTLLIHRRPTYREFIRGRLRRLYPPLLGVLVGGVVLAAAWPESAVAGRDALRHAGVAVVQLSSPWLASDIGPLSPFDVTWSLSIEWYFYLLWPLAIPALMTLGPERATRVLIVVAAALFTIAAFQSSWWFYYGPLARFAELLAGAATAFWLSSGRSVRAGLTNAIAVTGLAFVAAWTVFGTNPYTIAYRLAAFPVVLVTAVALILSGYCSERGPVMRFLSWRPLTALGVISYSLYLWHTIPLVLTGGDWMGQSRAVVAGAGLGLLLVTTGLAYWYLERPFVRTHRRDLIKT
jgi:peptidoglycan/LPS O-acetylase OafA/YrhL